MGGERDSVGGMERGSGREQERGVEEGEREGQEGLRKREGAVEREKEVVGVSHEGEGERETGLVQEVPPADGKEKSFLNPGN